MTMLARATIGLWLWAFAFMILYALHGIFRWTMVVTWLCFALGGGAVILWAKRAPEGLERQLAITSSIVGLVGILVVGSPTALTSACL